MHACIQITRTIVSIKKKEIYFCKYFPFQLQLLYNKLQLNTHIFFFLGLHCPILDIEKSTAHQPTTPRRQHGTIGLPDLLPVVDVVLQPRSHLQFFHGNGPREYCLWKIYTVFMCCQLACNTPTIRGRSAYITITNITCIRHGKRARLFSFPVYKNPFIPFFPTPPNHTVISLVPSIFNACVLVLVIPRPRDRLSRHPLAVSLTDSVPLSSTHVSTPAKAVIFFGRLREPAINDRDPE